MGAYSRVALLKIFRVGAYLRGGVSRGPFQGFTVTFCTIAISALLMCKNGLLKIPETAKMHIYVQEVKFYQSIQQLLAIHINVHSEPNVTVSFFPQRLSLEFSHEQNQRPMFSGNHRIVYSEPF